MSTPDQLNEGERLLTARMRGAEEMPASAAVEARMALATAPATLGIRQCLDWLQEAYPDECAKRAELLNPEISDDNKWWLVEGNGRGNSVELVARVLFTDDVKAAALISDMINSLPEAERDKLKPEYKSEPAELNPFPLADMPSVMRDLAIASATINQSKPELSVVTMMGVFSAALGKGLELKTTKGRNVSGNLLLVVSMPTGTGKTSEAGPLLDMLHEYQRMRRHEHRKQGYRKQAELSRLQREIEKLESAASSDEEPSDKAQFDADMERLFVLKDEEAMLLASMAEPSVITEDATGEALIMMAAANNGVIASMSSDARDAFANLNGRYSNNGATGASIFIKGFSGDAIDQVRVGRGTLNTRPRVTVLWLVQPDCLKGLFNREEFRVSGLAPRFLICRIDPGVTLETYEDVETPTDHYGAFQARLDEVLKTYYQHEGKPFQIKPTFAAGTAITTYRNGVTTAAADGDLPGCEEFATRWAEQAWRMALVLHVAEHGAAAHLHDLEVHTAHAAVKLADWFSFQQGEMIAATSGEKTDAKLGVAKEWVRAHPEGSTSYHIYRKNQGVFNDAKDVKAVLDTLVAEGSIKRSMSRKGVYEPLSVPKRW